MESDISEHRAIARHDDRADLPAAQQQWATGLEDGRAYALLPVHASKLMILIDTPDYAVA